MVILCPTYDLGKSHKECCRVKVLIAFILWAMYVFTCDFVLFWGYWSQRKIFLKKINRVQTRLYMYVEYAMYRDKVLKNIQLSRLLIFFYLTRYFFFIELNAADTFIKQWSFNCVKKCYVVCYIAITFKSTKSLLNFFTISVHFTSSDSTILWTRAGSPGISATARKSKN